MTTATNDPEAAYVQDHAEALALLDEIEELLNDLPAPDFEGFAPHWGHVGDLELVLTHLRRARNQLAGNPD